MNKDIVKKTGEIKKNNVLSNVSNIDKIFLVIVICVVFSVIIWCFSEGISGNDYWWHVRTGAWIVENRQVPRTDKFSWTGKEAGITWIAHEWLTGFVIWKIRRLAGDIGIFLFCFLSALIMNGLMMWRNRRVLFDNCVFTGLFFGLFAVLSSMFFYGRPHLFGAFLLFAELHCLYCFREQQESRMIWLLPILAMIWSNFYMGAAVLAYVLPLLLWISGVCDLQIGRLYSCKRKRGEQAKLLLICFLSLGALCVNPFGWRALTYPYMQMGEKLQMQVIGEWAAPDIKQIGALVLFFFPILLTIVGVLLSDKKIEMFDFLLMFFFAYLFLRSQRFILQYYISSSFWAFHYVLPVSLKQKLSRLDCIVLGIFLMGDLVFGGWGIWKTVETYRAGNIISRELSESMVNLVREDGADHLFNDYNYGGELIFYGIEVFFDGRGQLFAQTDILRDGVNLIYLSGGEDNCAIDVEGILDKYGVKRILIKKSRPLYCYLRSHGESYELLGEDEDAAYYKIIYH